MVLQEEYIFFSYPYSRSQIGPPLRRSIWNFNWKNPAMKVLLFTLIGVIIWNSQRTQSTKYLCSHAYSSIIQVYKIIPLWSCYFLWRPREWLFGMSNWCWKHYYVVIFHNTKARGSEHRVKSHAGIFPLRFCANQPDAKYSLLTRAERFNSTGKSNFQQDLRQQESCTTHHACCQ